MPLTPLLQQSRTDELLRHLHPCSQRRDRIPRVRDEHQREGRIDRRLPVRRVVVPPHRRVRGRDVVRVAADHEGHPDVREVRDAREGLEAVFQVGEGFVEGVAFVAAHDGELGVLAEEDDGFGIVAESLVRDVEDGEEVEDGLLVAEVQGGEELRESREGVDWGVEAAEEVLLQYGVGEAEREVRIWANSAEGLFFQRLEYVLDAGFDVVFGVVGAVEGA